MARQEPRPAEEPAPATPAQATPVVPIELEAQRKPLPVVGPRYHGHAEVVAFVDAWLASVGPGRPLIERIELPPTRAGRAVPALQWGASGPTALKDRPAVFLIGALDGVSLSGSEAVLSIASAALAENASLPPGVTFVAVPWASPDALAATLDEQARDGRSALPLDDDGDQRTDEDGPDDVDGDGLVLDMLIEDPEGPWTRSADPRFLAAARTGDTPRFHCVREGRDDDGDGLFNEDPKGGVDLDRAFPIGWAESGPLTLGGPLPLDEPPARALADLLLARRSACVLLFQGNHGELAIATARAREAAPASALAFGVLARTFAESTGRKQGRLAAHTTARGEPRAGAALEWIDAVTGAIAAEVAVWGPAVERAPDGKGVRPVDARSPAPDGAGGAGDDAGAAQASEGDRAWGRWLDNTRGGIGFVEWHPVELGDGRQVWVGGWEAFSRLNPPPKSLALALQGLPDFVRRAAAALPVLELRLREVRRDGEVCTIRARLENQGALPTGLASGAHASGVPGARVRLILPAGARLLAGDADLALEDLAGGCASRELEWVVLAPAGAVLSIEADAPLAATIRREVKP